MQTHRLIFILCLVIFGWSVVSRADVYVNDDNTTGPWEGTQEYPFATIQEGINAALTDSVVNVATGMYTESIVVSTGLTLLGGWADDWSERDWESHVSHVYFDQPPPYMLDAVVLNSNCRFDGFHLTFLNAFNEAAIHAQNVANLRIENIRILKVLGFMDSITHSAGVATGILLENCGSEDAGIIIRQVEIKNVHGGAGANGEFHSGADGYSGEPGYGIILQWCSAVTIEDIWIHDITGGFGGAADPRASGMGGSGAAADGIAIALCSNVEISRCLIEVVKGGRGGAGKEISNAGGQGGTASGLTLLGVDGIDMMNVTIRYITGGTGGSSQETHGSGADGGIGANGRAIDVTGGHDIYLFNSLIHSIRGGDGGFGYSGGDAGDAVGIRVDSEQPEIRQVTVAYCYGGTGGDRYAADPGSGGDSVGLDVGDSAIDAMGGVLVCRGWGGQPGKGLQRSIPGFSTGTLSTSAVSLQYVNSWGHDVNYSGCLPGIGSFSLDPLFAEKPGWQPFFLSSQTAGQLVDSPCIDAIPEDPSGLYPGDHYTTQTDLNADSILLDMGYHFDVSQTPLPVTTPVVTASPTPNATETPTPTATMSLGVRIEMPEMAHPGELFGVRGFLDNPGAALLDIPVFFILQIDDSLWFWNDWTMWMPPDAGNIDFERMIVPRGLTSIAVVPEFIWPDTGTDHRMGLRFYGAMLTPDMLEILGSWTMVEWGYGPARAE